jgi:hypothetical protein
MSDRPPSAAEALYPNLRQQLPERPVQQQRGSVADAMFPHLVPPKPTDPYHESYLRFMKAMGLVPVDEGKR